jgi:hypothetical protein
MPQTPTIGRPFQSGGAWTGNRRGRPPVGESVAEYIRQCVGQDAKAIVDKLVEIALSPHRDVRARIQAAEVLLTRGFGKPPESVTISGSLATLDPSKLSRLTDEELEYASAIAARLLADDQAAM